MFNDYHFLAAISSYSQKACASTRPILLFVNLSVQMQLQHVSDPNYSETSCSYLQTKWDFLVVVMCLHAINYGPTLPYFSMMTGMTLYARTCLHCNDK